MFFRGKVTAHKNQEGHKIVRAKKKDGKKKRGSAKNKGGAGVGGAEEHEQGAEENQSVRGAEEGEEGIVDQL